jgi:hypothetical protein
MLIVTIFVIIEWFRHHSPKRKQQTSRKVRNHSLRSVGHSLKYTVETAGPALRCRTYARLGFTRIGADGMPMAMPAAVFGEWPDSDTGCSVASRPSSAKRGYGNAVGQSELSSLILAANLCGHDRKVVTKMVTFSSEGRRWDVSGCNSRM